MPVDIAMIAAPVKTRSRSGGSDLRRIADRLFKADVSLEGIAPAFSGLGVYPGPALGHLVIRPETYRALRSALGKGSAVPVIYAVDDGTCVDFDILSESDGLIASDGSPNAWCAVQAKCEGIPTVIAVDATFNVPEPRLVEREILVEAAGAEPTRVTIQAQEVEVTAGDGRKVTVREGDVVVLDGDTGLVYVNAGVTLKMPPAREAFYLLVDVVQEALERFGPTEAWERLTETGSYRRNRDRFVALVSTPEFREFTDLLRTARETAGLQVMAAGHTEEGAILARLFFADFDVDANGDLRIAPTTEYSGVGLLRSERCFRKPRELDALRTLILGEDIGVPDRYDAAKAVVAEHEAAWLASVLRANSGCPTVVRALCVPLNKLFPPELDLSGLCRDYGIDEERARTRIEQNFREAETFHGCRGARLHMLRRDLTELEIESILRAGAQVMRDGGDVDLTILVAMVTFPQEIERYIEWYDGVYDRLLAEGLRLPRVKLSMMIETSTAYHLVDRFFLLRGRHIALKGALFGGNDFTAATLNFNRRDAVRAVIPNYVRLGILPANPFLTLHADTVGRLMVDALERIRNVALDHDLLIGIGGEQSGDVESVRWLTRHAAPRGLSYVATSADMMVNALMASAMAMR